MNESENEMLSLSSARMAGSQQSRNASHSNDTYALLTTLKQLILASCTPMD
jgi:hypothetical protein